jgi:hypothetical protein
MIGKGGYVRDFAVPVVRVNEVANLGSLLIRAGLNSSRQPIPLFAENALRPSHQLQRAGLRTINITIKTIAIKAGTPSQNQVRA